MVDVRTLKPFDIIQNHEDGFLKDEYGIVNYSDGECAVATFIKAPEYEYIIGIWNCNYIDLVEEFNN